MWKVQKASSHANAVLYTIENAVYFQLPVSLVMAARVAMHGKYISTNTMNASADACENGAVPVIFDGVFNLSASASESPSPI